MLSQQASSIRELPSLDDDLHRLRPDGYASADTGVEEQKSEPSEVPLARKMARVPSVEPSEAASAFNDDGLSRPPSITGMAFAANLRGSKLRRRVQIQGNSGDDADDDDDEGVSGGRPNQHTVRLPGQPTSSTISQPHPAASGKAVLGTSPSFSGANGGAWLSMSRMTAAPMANLPPDDLPALHSAAWYNDLDTVLELLKTTPNPLKNLIWVNRKFYPQYGDLSGSARRDPDVPAAAPPRPPRLGQPSAGPLPDTATPENATLALKALLRLDFLHHACHPLTIAAAHGNERIVDELLKAMAEEVQSGKGEHPVTWRSLPPDLPPGCPWVTPLAAAALGGNGECVRLLAQAVLRRKSLMEDRSTFGCFRFRPLVVAQAADTVQALFKYGCCHPDTIRYSLCDAARRMAKLDCGCLARTTGPLRQSPPQRQQQPSHKTSLSQQPSGSTAAADGDDDGSPPDSPRNDGGSRASLTSRADTKESLENGPVKVTASGFESSIGDLKALGARGSLVAPPQTSAQQVSKASELMLFRSRLFHDSLGRPLSKALGDVRTESLVAFAALSALVENGLQPDRFLTHAEHPTTTSTSLLMILVQNYRSALQSAARGSLPPGAAGAAGYMTLTPAGGAAAGELSASAAATGSNSFSMSMGSAGNSLFDQGAGGDLLSVSRDVLNALVSGLLVNGAVVDDPPRDGCRQVGGFHIAPPHGPEAPLHHAFIHGPQELVVLLLQFSGLQPEAHEDLVGAALAGGGEEGGGEREGVAAVGLGKSPSAASKAFYARKPEEKDKGKQRKPKVPWEGGRSSPLLAFGCKVQSALVEGNVPLWLHSARFSELMEDLIKCTIASDACMVTADLTWVVQELFERCMAHEFDNMPQLQAGRGDHTAKDRPSGSSNTNDGGNTKSADAAADADATVLSQSTVITMGPASPSSAEDSARNANSKSSKHSHTHGHAHHRKRAFEDQAASRSPGANPDGTSPSSGSTTDASDSEVDADVDVDRPSGRAARQVRRGRLVAAFLSTPEDNISMSVIHSLYRHTADAITSLHQGLQDGSLDGPLASLGPSAGGAGGTATLVQASGSAGLVDWTVLLRLVARIAATTLNPPKSHGQGAGQISVFTTAKAVNQLLYARDWAQETPDGETPAESVIDIDLLRAVVRRHPHEAARLIHGIDLLRVELKGYRWDSIPMSLDQDFYAVLSAGETLKISNRTPTVAPARVAAAAAAAEAAQRRAEVAAGRARIKGSAVYPLDGDVPTATSSPSRLSGAGTPAGRASGFVPDDPAAGTEGLAAGAFAPEPLTREDLLQACIYSNMWTVLTHFLLSSTRLPLYMQTLDELRRSTYKYAILGQVFQYGSIPVIICNSLILTLLGILTRLLQRTIGLVGNIVLALYGRLEERLQPAMTEMGRKLQLDRMQRRVGRMVRRVDQLAHKATGGNVLSGSALMAVGKIPRYLSFLRVFLDPDELAEVWLGVTQHHARGRARLKGETPVGADDDGPAYMSWRTTRVVCNRVPLSCAAAMPAALLYKLASSPQVHGELFASPVMRAVITWRWQHYTRYFLLLQFVEHLLYMSLFMVYAFSLSYSPEMFSSVLGEARTAVIAREGCLLPPTGLQKFLLITLGVMTLTCVVQEFRQLLFFKLGWFRQPWNLMDFASSTIVGTIITLHLDCRTDEEMLRGLAAVEVALLFLRLLYFAMADDRLGSFFRMVIEVLRDCWLFFVFLGILFIGWGLALAVLQGQSGTVQDTYLQLFTMIFGDFSVEVLRSVDAGSQGLNYLWRMFVSVYQIMVTIILLNLLIAIINDSYERINDNETCESLRNKLTLIVEAESVLPGGMARSMLEALARTDLYVITAEAATVASTSMEQEGDSGEGPPARRPLPQPARWSGRMGETKRFILNVVDQLTAQQARFQGRVMAALNNMSSLKTAAEAVPAVSISISAGGATGAAGGSKRLSTSAAGALAGGASALRAGGPGGGPASAVPGSMVDMQDAEAFLEIKDLGKLLRDKLVDLQQVQEEGQRKQEEALVGMSRRLREEMDRVGKEVARAAAESAAAAATLSVATEAGPGVRAGTSGGMARASGSGGGSRGSGAGAATSELVVIERGALELVAQRAAEQAAQLAVEGVLRHLGRGQQVEA